MSVLLSCSPPRRTGGVGAGAGGGHHCGAPRRHPPLAAAARRRGTHPGTRREGAGAAAGDNKGAPEDTGPLAGEGQARDRWSRGNGEITTTRGDHETPMADHGTVQTTWQMQDENQCRNYDRGSYVSREEEKKTDRSSPNINPPS